MNTETKYLIWDTVGNRYRTVTGWVFSENELFENEKMLSFASREDADNLIKNSFINCRSYCISKYHPLFKHC